MKSDDVFHPQMRLIDLKRPVFIIPNLAIHLNREVNKGVELNRQKDLLPLAGMGAEQMSDQFFRELLAKELHVEPEEILDYEIGLYNAEQPEYVGIHEEFLSAPRIDNLSGVQAILTGITEAAGTESMWQHFLIMRKWEAAPSRELVPCFYPWCWKRSAWDLGRSDCSFYIIWQTVCFCLWMWGMPTIPIMGRRWILPTTAF